MIRTDLPLVSVVTPVYNGERYLEECINSVLSQTYTHWEYTIVNNRSNDKTADIAEGYAKRDKRIHVHNNEIFLDIIANHNHAFSLISPDSKYCKIVSADDFIMPECLTQLVELAETHSSVGIVGSYQLSGGGDEWYVRCTGLPYWRTVVSGKEICRLHLLGRLNVFGAPTVNLYRSDLIRSSEAFFPNSTAEADISACIKHLRDTDFGFVHQVLSYERMHGDRVTTVSRSMDAYLSSRISDLLTYGADYLTRPERDERLAELLDEYYRHMAIAAVNLRDRAYWGLQKHKLNEFGLRLDRIKLGKAICGKVIDLMLSPRETVNKVVRRWHGSVQQRSASVFAKEGSG
jgi:glycosyltransferase involved in cell wall biosynthesis